MKYEELLAIWRQYIQESDAIAEYNRKLYITPTQVEYYDELRDVRVVEEDVNDTRVLEVYLKCDFDVRAGVTPGPVDLIVDLRKWFEECKNGN